MRCNVVLVRWIRCQPVEQVEVDALSIGMGERYDVLVSANYPGVRQLAAQVEGTKSMARAIVRCKGRLAPPLQRMLSEQGFDRLTVDLPIEQRVIDAAPPTLKTGSQAQMRWREHGPVVSNASVRSKRSILSAREKVIQRLLKVRQRF
jgi:FtsP/CotA-like multicopper oxidase with cupredoxin domain